MRISWAWLCSHIDWAAQQGLSNRSGSAEGRISAQEGAARLTALGLEVEEVAALGAGLTGVRIVQILEMVPHTQSDRLSIMRVTLDGIHPLPQIVCGAKNMRPGDRVPLATLGATLPNGLTIQEAKIRGEVSNGMLCARDELGLAPAPAGDRSAEGLWILPADAPLGERIDQWLGLDDWVLVLKPTANRGDCLSHRGIARELAVSLGLPLLPLSHLGRAGWGDHAQGARLGSIHHTHSRVGAQQLHLAEIEGVEPVPSPPWLRKRLESIGARSMNAIVDWTNYLMWDVGQPVHAYDRDQLQRFPSGEYIEARQARSGEVLRLLDSKDAALSEQDIVIADAHGPIGLAGVMGGKSTEVTEQTRALLVEVAEFDPTSVRRSALRHARRTDAAARFEKGIDSEATGWVLERLVNGLRELAGTSKFRVLGSSVDGLGASHSVALKKSILLDLEWARNWLGMDFSNEEAIGKLRGLGFDVSSEANNLIRVEPPSYRRDVSLREDLCEELARTMGLDRVASTLPVTTSRLRLGSVEMTLEDRVKDHLAAVGGCEFLTYSFQSKELLEKFGLHSSVELLNPMSGEQAVLVPSLLPAIIDALLKNQNHHFSQDVLSARVFELRPTFRRVSSPSFEAAARHTGVVEEWKLAVAILGETAGKTLSPEVESFYSLKALLEYVFQKLRTKGVRMRPLRDAEWQKTPWLARIWHPHRSVGVWAGAHFLGMCGQLHPSLEADLKFRQPVFLSELDWKGIVELTPGRSQVYRPVAPNTPKKFFAWNDFPGIERDFALIVDVSVEAEALLQVAKESAKPWVQQVRVFDVYQGKGVPEGKKSVGLRVAFRAPDRSLREEEVEPWVQKMVQTWKKNFGAERRGE